MIGHVQLSLLIMWAHWGIDNYRPCNYLSDFAEIWLEDVYMCQDEIISQSDHSFNSYDQKSKRSIYVYH